MKRFIFGILSILFVGSFNCMETEKSESSFSELIPEEQALSYRDLFEFITRFEKQRRRLEMEDPLHQQPETVNILEENTAKLKWARKILEQKEVEPKEKAITKFVEFLKELKAEEKQLREEYNETQQQETLAELESNELLQSWVYQQIKQKKSSHNKQ